MLQDIDYNEQQAFYHLHITPIEYGKQPYYRMAEVLSAKSMDDRPLSGHDFMEQMGLSAKDGKKVMTK